jgi:predicted dehydrogenase
MSRLLLLLPLLLAALAMTGPPEATAKKETKVIRVGIIGLDTSHVVAFTSLLNGPNAGGDLAGVHVVAAFPGGSPDLPLSRDRVAGFTKQLRDKYKVEIVDSIEALLPKVDVVLLESVDGRPHLRQALPVLRAGKMLFIDKPIANSLADALLIFAEARRLKVPCFSSSSLRFSPGIAGMRNNPKVGKVVGCDAFGPMPLEKLYPDLFWYGVHGVEALYTIMGPGCEKVMRAHTAGTDLVTGVWKDGRIGTFRGIRAGKAGYGATVFGDKGLAPAGSDAGYQPLVVEICKFFRTGQPPVSAEETTEIVAFMEAADRSKGQGGAPVALADVMARARAEIGRRQQEEAPR